MPSAVPPKVGDQHETFDAALPGFGEMKVKALGSVLAKRFGVAVARELVPAHPTLGDIDSPQALTDYQAAKRTHKAEWAKTKAGAQLRVRAAYIAGLSRSHETSRDGATGLPLTPIGIPIGAIAPFGGRSGRCRGPGRLPAALATMTTL